VLDKSFIICLNTAIFLKKKKELSILILW